MSKFQQKYVTPHNQFILLISGLVLFMLGYLLARKGIYGPEITIFRAVNSWPEQLSPVFKFVSFGGTLLFAILGTCVFYISKRRVIASELAITGIAAWAIVNWLKYYQIRLRPSELITNVQLREHIGQIAGYPSGHATIVTALGIITYPYLSPRQRFVLVLSILLVYLSRLYLGMHFPLDIIGGIGVGMSVASLVNIAFLYIGPHQRTKADGKK